MSDILLGVRIKIEKIGEVKPGLPANPAGAHISGQIQNENFSLPLQYTVEGELIGEIVVGKSVNVQRDTRNGVKVSGFFVSSTVTEVTDKQFKTRNSVYNYHLAQ